MFLASASPWIHLKEINSCRTWLRSCSYSCLHCVLSCASVTFGWPLAGAGVALRLVATHLVYPFSGSGTAAFAWPVDLAATVIQWVNSSLLTASPSTVAT